MTVWVAVGTRPEAIKMAPVIRGLRRVGLLVRIVSTGQHDRATREALRPFGLAADLDLAPVPAGTPLAGLLAHVTANVGRTLAREPRPAAILVHGDTTGALGTALAAANAQIPVGHVEAGLRTGDPTRPFPEELNRRLIDRVADLWLAPTPLARDRLVEEGCAASRVHVTGNPIVDAVTWIGATPPDLDAPAVNGALAAAAQGRALVLVTAHRRESFGAPLSRICRAAAALAADGAVVVWPVHPNPQVDGPVRDALADTGVLLAPPVPYPAFVHLLKAASLVLTDSGGVQEEAACLGRPTLVLRDVTERPEVLATGVVSLVGTDPDRVVAHARSWLADPPRAAPGPFPLGDGTAGARIGALVDAWIRCG